MGMWSPVVGGWIVRRTGCIGNLAGVESLPFLANTRCLPVGEG
jgi:hypothetical protein